MKNLRKILIPIDFSPVAVNAVRYANSILEKHLAEVVLVYVNTPHSKMEEAVIKKLFKAFEASSLKDVSFYYDFVMMNGELLSELVHAAELFEAELIIMGTKENRKSDLSLASALTRSVYCPVIVVPEHFNNRRIRKIAYANDYKPIRESFVFKPLWEFALEFRAKVYVLHVNQKKVEKLVPVDESESSLEYFLESIEHEWVYLTSDDMEFAINNYLKDNKIDLLVILSRDHGSNQLESEGRLVARLTAHAQIPVLILC
ncbi:universal stress protein [Cesiribacter sp. SM1]|uniref:universal stress protein n=1 Tax=Cesiribacter sp. SM1 TaxID=2861196 RepID=UPI001CD75CE5|nr:universal stress protein [Cesiribacter sp. SM1]